MATEFREKPRQNSENAQPQLVLRLWRTGELPPEGSPDAVIYFDYVCQILNLFEMAVRLRGERIVPKDVFASWVAWFYDVSSAPGFAPIWTEIRSNYIPKLRKTMDTGIECARSANTPEAGRTAYFRAMAKMFRVRQLKRWVEEEGVGAGTS